jgi:hypothetical protein
MDEHDNLKVAADLADAELGVAEELAWPLAILAAITVHLKLDNWLITVACAAGAYYLTVFRYRRKATKAEDEYFRSASLGKYAQHNKNDA